MKREELKQQIIDAVRKNPSAMGISVEVKGTWLIENDIAEAWYQLRKIDSWRWEAAGIVDGKITYNFKDYVTLSQALVLGLLDFV